MFFFKPNVEKMMRKRDVEGLIKALKYDDPKVRYDAAKALGELGDPRAVEPLIFALADKSSDIWIADISSSVLGAVAEALGKIGNPRAVEPLISALRYSEDVRAKAAEALDKLGWKPGQDENAVWYWFAKRDWGKCIDLGAVAVKPLISAFLRGIGRNAAAEVLVKIGNPRALGPLIFVLSALMDENWNVSLEAAWTLVKMGGPSEVDPYIISQLGGARWQRKAMLEALAERGGSRALEQLISALRDKDENVRARAAEALAIVGPPGAELLISAFLKDEDNDIREVAAEALGELGDPNFRFSCCKIWGLHKVIIKALGELGDPRAVGTLIFALGDKDFYTRLAAKDALVKIGLPAVEPLLSVLKVADSEMRRFAEEAIVKIGLPAVEALISTLRDKDSSVRWDVSVLLRRITGEYFGEDPEEWQKWWEKNKERFIKGTQ